jgi:opacity protein-like surface antigen
MRKLFLILAVSLIAQYAFGQIVLGINANSNYSFLTSLDNDVDVSPGGIGVGYGFSADLYFTENYALTTGLEMINYRGINVHAIDMTSIDQFANVDISGVIADTFALTRAKASYLAIPITLKLNTVEIGYSTFFADFGIVSCFIRNAKGTVQLKTEGLEDETKLEEIEIAATKMVNRLLLSYRVGAGVSYALGGSTALNLGLYYDSSMRNFINLDTQEGVLLNNIALRAAVMF